MLAVPGWGWNWECIGCETWTVDYQLGGCVEIIDKNLTL